MTKILVIEDADTLRSDVIEMLSFEGYEVIDAENGLVGVDKAFAELPDLIVCDIMMPELDGHGVLERIRADERTATIPFIFLTARTERVDMRQGMTKGADDYLTKPFNSNELISTIQAQLAKQNTLTQKTQKKLRQLSDSITTALPHELRTPLNSIMGFSDMLMLQAETITPADIADYAQHISSATTRLYRLVENYLAYVRVQILRTNPDDMQVLRQSITHDPVSILEFQATHKASTYKRDADLQLHLDANLPIQISDQDLNKAIEEAIDNAFKFSKEGTLVTISTFLEPPYYVISIQDVGHGMSQEQIQSIGAYMQFDRWMQEQQGSGLGLVIVREFLNIYDGKLEIESNLSQGTNLRLKVLVAN